MMYFIYDTWMNFKKKKYAMWNSQSQNTTYLMIEVASLMAQMVKNLLAVHKTWVRYLGWEDSPREGNGNPLQHSCLENPMDGGDWQATSIGSQTAGHDWATSLAC